ncbi:MAG: hypothetical protein K2Z81_03695, partial [Cyanobacteria bacterium]|nr:hypothetical protein [Cyanobacteriota bacterium]
MSGESAVTTIDDLDAMLSKLDGDEVVKFFAGMTEKERKPFAERAMLWYEIGLANIETSLFWGNVLAFSDDLPKRTREQITLLKKVESGEIKISSKVKSRESTGVSRLALTACAGLSELRKLPFPDAKPAFEIMRDRKPKWLDRWLDFACGLTPYESWELAREFEREGICQAEHGEGYWLAMALTLGQKPADELVAVLNSDAELIDTMVWQMLGSDAAIRALSDPTGINAQVNDRRRVTLDTDWRNWSLRVENSRRASYIWRTVLADCAQKNQSYQDRLLDIVFEWLARLSGDAESKPTSGLAGELTPVAWFQGLHDEMNLSAEQKGKLAVRYIGLLSLKDSSTLNWTVQNLQDCDAQSLPVEDLVMNLSRLFYHKRKDPAVSALKLIESLEKNKLLTKKEAANAAIEALEHPSVEVQKKVLSYLKKSKMLDSAETITALQSRAEGLSGLVKKSVLEIVAKHSDPAASAGDSLA